MSSQQWLEVVADKDDANASPDERCSQSSRSSRSVGPANLSATETTDSSVDLDWDASVDDESGVDHYNVYVGGTRDQEVAAGTTSTTIDGLSADTGYAVPGSDVDGVGNVSAPSNTVTVSIAGGDTGNDDGPTAPANLSSPSHTDTTIDFDRDHTNDEADIDRYTVFGNDGVFGYMPSSDISLTATGISLDTSYDVYLVAVGVDGNVSDQSNTITVTTD